MVQLFQPWLSNNRRYKIILVVQFMRLVASAGVFTHQNTKEVDSSANEEWTCQWKQASKESKLSSSIKAATRRCGPD